MRIGIWLDRRVGGASVALSYLPYAVCLYFGEVVTSRCSEEPFVCRWVRGRGCAGPCVVGPTLKRLRYEQTAVCSSLTCHAPWCIGGRAVEGEEAGEEEQQKNGNAKKRGTMKEEGMIQEAQRKNGGRAEEEQRQS